MIRRIILLGLAVVCLFVSTAVAAEKNLRISFSAPATVYLPLWAAKEAGFFAKQGLAVEVIHVGSSPIALSALMTDETQVLVGGGTVAPTAYLAGNRDMTVFARMNNRFVFAIYSHPSITDIAGLKGKKFGVTRFGGTLDYATRYFFRQRGIDVRKDLNLIQMGRVPDIAGAIAAGSIDAGTISFPHHLLLKKLGFRELADLSKMDARYASTAFVARRSFLAANRDTMERFLKAMVESIHYVKTHRAEALKILSAYTRLTDMDVIGPDFDFHAENIWPRLPEIQPEDLKLILEELAERNPKAREINPSDIIYNVPVQAVAKSGFVEQVYK